MSKRNWAFESSKHWSLFARSFVNSANAWKPSLAFRIAGWHLKLEDVDAESVSLQRLAEDDGIVFDMRAYPDSGRKTVLPAVVQLTLQEHPDGTVGSIYFYHSLGGVGKELGNLARTAIQQVDPGVRFQDL